MSYQADPGEFEVRSCEAIRIAYLFYAHPHDPEDAAFEDVHLEGRFPETRIVVVFERRNSRNGVTHIRAVGTVLRPRGWIRRA
jgi:hypothetical protein